MFEHNINHHRGILHFNIELNKESQRLIFLIKEIARMAQILFLIYLMEYFDPSKQLSVKYAIVYSSLILLSLSVCATVDHTFFWNSTRYGMQVKTAISGLLYDKVKILLNEFITDLEI